MSNAATNAELFWQSSNCCSRLHDSVFEPGERVQHRRFVESWRFSKLWTDCCVRSKSTRCEHDGESTFVLSKRGKLPSIPMDQKRWKSLVADDWHYCRYTLILRVIHFNSQCACFATNLVTLFTLMIDNIGWPFEKCQYLLCRDLKMGLACPSNCNHYSFYPMHH